MSEESLECNCPEDYRTIPPDEGVDFLVAQKNLTPDGKDTITTYVVRYRRDCPVHGCKFFDEEE